MNWIRRHFESGTVIVTRDVPTLPHYYVRGFGEAKEDERYGIAETLRDWLNAGGHRPVWMQNLWRESETKATHEDGFAITATGPMILRPGSDPGALDWIQDPSNESQNERARLIDRICGLVESPA